MQVLGFNNIEKYTYNDEWIELLSDLKKDKNFIEKLSIENILINREQDYNDEFNIYAYFKNTNYSHIRPNLISIKDNKEIKLLKTEYIDDINDKFNSKDIFEAIRNSMLDVMMEPGINRPREIYYTLYYICDTEEDKEFIKTNKNILKQLEKLNNTYKIKVCCGVQFNIKCKTVDEIFNECSFDIEDYKKKEEEIENKETE